MRAGQLRHRLEVQRVTATVLDEHGEPTHSWSTEATIWGAVEPTGGDERLQAAQLDPEVTHKIRIRARITVTPAYRVLYDDRTFEVLSVIEVGERMREQWLMCKERVGAEA